MPAARPQGPRARPETRHPQARPALRLALAAILVVAAHAPALAAARRLVVLKVDGLPYPTLDRFVSERDPRTGKSLLPWIEHVFYERGARLENFYVRGMSLSGPSWSLLDTGRHLQIKGNVEFDRLTLHSYDYLNFIPFWLANASGARADMPGVELLDEMGLPLLADAYPYDERYLSFQLYQRGTRWTTLQRGLQNRVTSRTPRELLDEWTIGIDARDILTEQQERELISKLADPRVRYLDFYTTDFDHAAHHNRDRATQLESLRQLDRLVGRVWSAAGNSPLGPETVFVLVSDHGTNSDERVFSQGYNVVKLLGSAAGGGHHVVTKRRLMSDYALKGVNPLIPLVHTTTSETFYLKGQSTRYPTALVDFDGNERTSVHLRDGGLNLLHILLLELRRKDLAPGVRRAATSAFFGVLEGRRAGWRRQVDELNEELGALRRAIERQRAAAAKLPKEWTKIDRDAGLDREAQRVVSRLNVWLAEEREYSAYARTLAALLALDPEGFDPRAVRVEQVIAPGAMGDANDLHSLQNYPVGLRAGGLVLTPDGALDFGRSFERVNYLALFGGVTVRNNVQAGVSNRPVDFVAVRLDPSAFNAAVVGGGAGDGAPGDEGGDDLRADEAVWLYSSEERQALVLARGEGPSQRLRYVPVRRLRQDGAGRITFERVAWGEGFPLKLWEDPRMAPQAGAAREFWLSGWHTDREWLRAAHMAKYPHAVVGLHEQLARHRVEATDHEAAGLSTDERLIRRFRARQRRLVEADLLVLANDHWNFDVRGFNPGGNHGSFLRSSAHAALMFAGGERAGVPAGLIVREPYDSLSFVPTLLALTGQLQSEGTPAPALWQKGFRRFPGPVISELFEGRPAAAPLASSEAGPEREP
ncbi:MAG TPA: alkaline phosphatase family protein [Pyrinomonadaceae bacterium]|nr:alkaline phosphatase family protein [Pyrinomonadaceae bacterium]